MPHPEHGHIALRRGRFSLPGHAYFITTTTHQRCARFNTFSFASTVCRCLARPALHGDAQLLAWVLMPDHMHLLIQLGERDSLPVVINRIKSASTREANRTHASTGPLWQRGYHDHALRAEEDLKAAARYLIANPVRAGLVAQVSDYPFWNAVWL